MKFIGNIIEKLQRHPKRVVFPEGEEPRILQAARQYASLRLGAPILLGNRSRIKKLAEEINVPLDGIRLINPEDSDDMERFAKVFERLRKDRGVGPREAMETMVNANYFGAMMVAMHQADGMISGTSEVSGSVLRPLFQIIKVAPQAETASSCMIMEVENSKFGEDGVLFMGDCGVIPDPSVEQLADIAVNMAKLFNHLTSSQPRVAMLSFSTKGSATHASIGKMQAATELARQKASSVGLKADFDGEMQVDAALIDSIANRKLPESRVAGQANCLVFPDLNAGNIASKLLQYVTRANAYGQILLGLDRPAADVSRGSNSHDILGVASIVGLQSIAYQELYPGAGEQLPEE